MTAQIQTLARRLALRPAKRRWRPADPLARRGERLAARTMRRAGCRVLRRNFQVGVGEADLVCLGPDRRTLVIVEVKARRRESAGDGPSPERAVTRRKREKLIRVAYAAAARLRMRGAPLRIDVVAVDFPPKGQPIVRHCPSAVRST